MNNLNLLIQKLDTMAFERENLDLYGLKITHSYWVEYNLFTDVIRR